MKSAAKNARNHLKDGEAPATTSSEVLKFTGAKTGSSKEQIPSCTYMLWEACHHPLKYRFRDVKCHHCGKEGHIKPACLALKV